MKQKGFTIVEMLITLTLLASIGLIVGIGLNKTFKSNNDTKIKNFENQIISATDIYVNNHNSLLQELHTTKEIVIKLEYVIGAGLIDSDLIDPSTNEKVSPEKEIRLSLDNDGLLIIELVG